MLYRVAAKLLNGHERAQRFVNVEAKTGDEAAALAHMELKEDAGPFAVIVEDVRPAPKEVKTKKKAG